MTGLVVFLGAHWKGLLAAVGGVVIGAYLGRVTAPKPISLPPPACPACPELHCAASVDAGVVAQSECKSKVVVRTIVTDAGCPEQVVSVDTSGQGTSAAQTATDAVADAKPPTPPPLAPVTPLRPPGPTWEGTFGAGVTGEGQLQLPVGGRWYPGGGSVGLGLEGDVRPKAWKQSSIGVSVTLRGGP